MTTISDSTVIILGTHLQHVFPKESNLVFRREKKKFALISSVYIFKLLYYKSKITCCEIVVETNTTSGKHTTPSMQRVLI